MKKIILASVAVVLLICLGLPASAWWYYALTVEEKQIEIENQILPLARQAQQRQAAKAAQRAARSIGDDKDDKDDDK